MSVLTNPRRRAARILALATAALTLAACAVTTVDVDV